jgi:hypothetical protein
MTQRTIEQIRELVKQYRERGEMTRRAFCESRGISLSMLDYYLRRYGKSATAPAAKLVKVKVEPAAAAAVPGLFTLVLRNGRRIESAWTFADAELARLIRVVEAA